MKLDYITSHRLKILQKQHLYMVLKKNCFSYVPAFCTNTIGIWWYICKHYLCSNWEHTSICFSFWYWRTKNETKNSSIPSILHSVISAVITNTIHGRPTILVMNHIYNRQISYVSGVMTCRSTVNGVSLGEKLSKLTVEDLELEPENNTDNLHENTKGLLKAISSACKAMGHTDEAAKYAWCCCFSMLDHYRLNSLF